MYSKIFWINIKGYLMLHIGKASGIRTVCNLIIRIVSYLFSLLISMSNHAPVLLIQFEDDTTTKSFATALQDYMSDYYFERHERQSGLKKINEQHAIVLVNGDRESSEFYEKFDEITQATDNRHRVVVIVYTTQDSPLLQIDEDWEFIAVFKMLFRNNMIDTKENRECREKIRSELKRVKLVLIYDIENGDTTKKFVAALKSFMPEYKFINFRDAENERSFPIFAIARHYSQRYEDYLTEIRRQLSEDNVKDLRRVSVIYFCDNKNDTQILSDIQHNYASKHRENNFRQIIAMDFVEDSLNKKKDFCLPIKLIGSTDLSPKKINLRAQIALRSISCANKLKKITSVAVYSAEKSTEAEKSIQELREANKLYKIDLQEEQSIDKFTTVDSPTLVYSTVLLNDEQIKKIETSKKNIMFIHITGEDIVENPQHDKTWCEKFWEVSYKGCTLAPIVFLTDFKDFVLNRNK